MTIRSEYEQIRDEIKNGPKPDYRGALLAAIGLFVVGVAIFMLRL